MPQILADDNRLLLTYETAPSGEQYAFVKFVGPYAHYFGWPNDETIKAHPLASRGLGPYDIFEIRDSSWVRALAQLNSIHPRHDPSRFKTIRHFVFTFHDRTFECLARDAVLVAMLPNDAETLGNLPSLMATYLL